MKNLLVVIITLLNIQYLNIAKAGSLKDEYELKERCGKQAEKWYTKEYGKNGVLSKKDFVGGGHTDLENHYNLKLNKCFIKQYFYFNDGAENKQHVWESIQVSDINESRVFGSFNENATFKVIDCSVNGKRCQTEDEFNALIKPYMEE